VEQTYDLILCNQVLEHLYNLDVAFSNFKKLLADEGLLWLTVPASNFRHGSPEYFASGYSHELMTKFALKYELEVIRAGELSIKRAYLMRHLLQIWPSNFQSDFPAFAYFGIAGSLIKKIFFNLYLFPFRFILQVASNEPDSNYKYSVETFGLFRNTKNKR
jgi:SAM-dependent methyltransferase